MINRVLCLLVALCYVSASSLDENDDLQELAQARSVFHQKYLDSLYGTRAAKNNARLGFLLSDAIYREKLCELQGKKPDCLNDLIPLKKEILRLRAEMMIG